MAKKITLPVGNKIIFDYMAEAYMSHEKKKPSNPSQFIKEVSDELAEEAFLHSFTPSGEIGDNPRKLAKKDFFLHFNEVFSPYEGLIAERMPHASKAKIKAVIRDVKSAIVTLVKVISKEFHHQKMSDVKKKKFNLFISTMVTISVRELLDMNDDQIIEEISNGVLAKLNDSEFISTLKD